MDNFQAVHSLSTIEKITQYMLIHKVAGSVELAADLGINIKTIRSFIGHMHNDGLLMPADIPGKPFSKFRMWQLGHDEAHTMRDDGDKSKRVIVRHWQKDAPPQCDLMLGLFSKEFKKKIGDVIHPNVVVKKRKPLKGPNINVLKKEEVLAIRELVAKKKELFKYRQEFFSVKNLSLRLGVPQKQVKMYSVMYNSGEKLPKNVMLEFDYRKKVNYQVDVELTSASIGKKFGIGCKAVENIAAGRTWNNI